MAEIWLILKGSPFQKIWLRFGWSQVPSQSWKLMSKFGFGFFSFKRSFLCSLAGGPQKNNFLFAGGATTNTFLLYFYLAHLLRKYWTLVSACSNTVCCIRPWLYQGLGNYLLRSKVRSVKNIRPKVGIEYQDRSKYRMQGQQEIVNKISCP